jgi:hypothetical protein
VTPPAKFIGELFASIHPGVHRWFVQNTDFVKAMSFALAFWAFLQLPGMDRTFLWEPDRQMLANAFKLRQGIAALNAPPVVWLEVGGKETDKDKVPLPAIVPREEIVAALRGVRESSAAVVVLDVDLAFQDQDESSNIQLENELKNWANEKSTPILLLARGLVKLPENSILPPTRYDSILEKSKRMFWVSANLCRDERAQVRSIPGPETYLDIDAGPKVLLNVVDATVKAAGGVTSNRSAEQIPCVPKPILEDPWPQERLIDWHIPNPNGDAGLKQNSEGIVVNTPRVGLKWKLPETCGSGSERAIDAFQYVSSEDLSKIRGSDQLNNFHAALCGRIVIIGADSALHVDQSWTPIGVLSGPVILANAIRGAFADGISESSRYSIQSLFFQLLILILFVILTDRGFNRIETFRLTLRRIAPASIKLPRYVRDIGLSLSHPLAVKLLFSIIAFWVAASVTAIGLNWGLWGALSAPTYVAALTSAGALLRREAENEPKLGA